MKYVIITQNQMLYISRLLKQSIENHNHNCEIVKADIFNKSYKQYGNDCTFIIYCIFTIEPKSLLYIRNRFIIYQLEQHVNDNISRHYSAMLENGLFKLFYSSALKNYDYCQQNISVFKNKFPDLDQPKLFEVPIGRLKKHKTLKDIDILFVGCINQKRTDIIQKIGQVFPNVKVITYGIFDIELANYLERSKIVLNIHFYDNAILERVRINEALQYGTFVISEKPNQSDISAIEYYKDVVVFVEDENNFVADIQQILDNYDLNHKIQLSKLETFMMTKNDDFENSVTNFLI